MTDVTKVIFTTYHTTNHESLRHLGMNLSVSASNSTGADKCHSKV